MNFTRQRDGRATSPEFSLVFPAYNPGPRLRDTLSALDRFLRTADAHWELLFVCDGCTDGSAEILRDWRASAGTVRVLSYAPNRGKGYALRQGLTAAAAPYRLFTDIDLAYPFEDILRLADMLRRGAPVVIGSRSHVDSQVQMPASLLGYAFRRHVQSKVFGLLARTLLPLAQGDTQAGLKGFSDTVVRTVVPHLRCDGFGFDCEMLTACVRHGYAVAEVPVHVRYDGEISTTNFRSTLRMVSELWRIRQAWPAVVAGKIEPQPIRYREAG